ncbi:MAG: hypothetical protein ACYTG1_02410 [Planctomycetota bacterium]|jgi:hypothetical protein
MIHRLIIGAIALAIAAPAPGQWTDQNLPIADGAGEQVQPKIVPTADGGAYVSWFDNGTGGYDVYLQRLDADGNEQWAHNGVLVADRGFSSTQDYGLSVDAAGHALLAFRDDRFAGEQITAARVTPAGTLAWGVNGVQLTSDSAFHAAPGIAGTTDGGIIVAWTNDADVKVQKLDATGTPQWGAGLTLSDGAGGEYLFSDIHAADAGTVIVSWNRQQSFSGAKHIYAQKFDTAGTALWNAGAPLVVFDGGSLQFGNFPEFSHDGAGGAVFGWYSSSPSLQCYAQHVLADGTEAFGHNGAVGSTNASQLRVSPAAAYDPMSGDLYLFWTETNGLQSMFGVYGQRFDAAGNRQWTDNGLVVRPLSATTRNWVNTIALGGGAIVSFIEGGGSETIAAAHVDSAGSFTWSPSFTTVSTVAGDKTRLRMVQEDDRALLVWQEGAAAADVYGQNLNADGSLGAASCPEDVDGNGDVGVNDLLAVLAAWGTCPGGLPCPEDVTGDLRVLVDDLLAVLAQWGPC